MKPPLLRPFPLSGATAATPRAGIGLLPCVRGLLLKKGPAAATVAGGKKRRENPPEVWFARCRAAVGNPSVLPARPSDGPVGTRANGILNHVGEGKKVKEKKGGGRDSPKLASTKRRGRRVRSGREEGGFRFGGFRVGLPFMHAFICPHGILGLIGLDARRVRSCPDWPARRSKPSGGGGPANETGQIPTSTTTSCAVDLGPPWRTTTTRGGEGAAAEASQRDRDRQAGRHTARVQERTSRDIVAPPKPTTNNATICPGAPAMANWPRRVCRDFPHFVPMYATDELEQ